MNFVRFTLISAEFDKELNRFPKDFEKLCADEKINIIDKVFLNRSSKRGKFTSLIPNFLAVEGVYLLEK